jgi:transmembrane sensor
VTNLSSSIRSQIAAEAVEWHLKLHEGPTAATHDEFSQWLTRSPTHIEEYLAVSTAWAALEGGDASEHPTESLIAQAKVPDDDNVVPLNPPGRVNAHFPEARRGRAFGWVAGAAALTVLSVVGWRIVEYRETDLHTAIGEQRSVSLSDGSVVSLNTNSEVRVHLTAGERRIDLLKGEARFHVAKDAARPFLVATNDATVKALGTIFNVRATTQDTEIAVLEGKVEVVATAAPDRPSPESAPLEGGAADAEKAPATLELPAGQRVAVKSNRIQRDAGASLEAVNAWTERRLVFRAVPLADVIDEFNRYRVARLVVDDDKLAALEISGVFDSGDPDSLLAYLKTFETVRISTSGDGTLHLAAASSPSFVK